MNMLEEKIDQSFSPQVPKNNPENSSKINNSNCWKSRPGYSDFFRGQKRVKFTPRESCQVKNVGQLTCYSYSSWRRGSVTSLQLLRQLSISQATV